MARSHKSWLWLVLVLALASCRSPDRMPVPPVAEPCPPLSAIFLDSGWRFRFDPADVGLTEAWFSPNTDDSEWIDLAPGEPWEFSGHDYDGIAWYRTKVTLPDWSALYLGIGGIDDAATLWVDGEQVANWQETDPEATILDMLQYGSQGDQLDLTFRVEDKGQYGGIKQPLYLSPMPHEVVTGGQYISWLSELYPNWPLPGQGAGHPFAWTMTGLRDAADEALLSSDGAVAPWATAPMVEIWLYDPTTGEVNTGAMNNLDFSLAKDRLPLPQWEWTSSDISLRSELFTEEHGTHLQVVATNGAETQRDRILLVAVRPFSVNRQLALICAIGMQGDDRLWINGEPYMTAEVIPDDYGVGLMDEMMDQAMRGEVPGRDVISYTPAGDGAALWSYQISLDPGESFALSFAFPAARGDSLPDTGIDVDSLRAESVDDWEQAIGQTIVDLPDDLIENGVAASMGYLLLALDPDGPHPGPLVHDAVWVRDTAYIGLALLQFGHGEIVREFIPAVLDAQEANGQVPPIQGENIPWDDDEWDAQGEAIFLVTSTYRYSGDRELLAQWYPALRASARFIVKLRATRTDPEGPAAGLLPPSKSAEDLGPADWHHYWDNYWAVIGLEEAAYAANELGESEDAAWMQAEADALRGAILASVEAVMGKDAAYIPGAVEGVESSAMARGTVSALWPIRLFPSEMPLLQRSFDHYYQLWIAPNEGGFRHRQGQFWTYGGLELAHAYLRLDRTDVLHQILSWTLSHQTLPGTYAWAEQVNPSNGDFSGGDMPHAWAAASYVTLVREMLVSEIDDSLMLFGGVAEWWFGAGQTITLGNAPTHFGTLYLHTESSVQQENTGWAGELTLTLSGDFCPEEQCANPPGGFRWKLPQKPATVDGPMGTRVENGWLIVPGVGGTVRLVFGSDN